MKDLNREYYPHAVAMEPGAKNKKVYTDTGKVGDVTQLAVAYNELVDAVFGEDNK